jgi:hypothetical protein
MAEDGSSTDMVMDEMAVPDGIEDTGWGEDTGDPDDDTGLPGGNRRQIQVASEHIERGLRELQHLAGGQGVSTPDLIRYVQHMYRHGHRRGHRRGFKRGITVRDSGVHWGRSRRMEEFRRYIIDRYRAIHHGDVIQGPGFYYGTIEANFQTEATASANLALATISVPDSGQSTATPIIDTAFGLGIGDTSTTWFGGPHVMNEADTNLQNPGTNLFADELFIIEAISARIRGVRVQYAPADIEKMAAPASTPGTIANMVVNGKAQLWDQAGQILPAELFNQFHDSCRLAKNLAAAATLHFVWQDKGIGGGGTTTDALIDSYLHVPGSHEMNLRRTSGGAPTLDLPQGFIWVLDKQFMASREQGGNGLFDAELHLDESTAFPFVPVSVFGLAPGSAVKGGNNGVPIGFALYWQLRLHGTALLPGRREFRELGQRMRRL